MTPDKPEVLRAAAEACAAVRRRRRPLLFVWRRPIAPGDPLQVFAAGRRAFALAGYWKSLDGSMCFAALGAARTYAARGAGRVAAMAQALEEERRTSVGGEPAGEPLFGGFAFSDTPPSPDGPWRGWAPAFWFRPAVTVGSDGRTTWCTLSLSVAPHDTKDQVSERLLRLVAAAHLHARPGPRPSCRRVDVPDPAAWKGRVQAAKAHLRGPRLEKVVLARSARVASHGPLDPAAILSALSSDQPGTALFAIQAEGRVFVGASPERLVRLTSGSVETACLAGSAPRGRTPEEDESIGRALLASPKDQSEHDIVRRMLGATLAELGMRPEAGETRLRRLPHVQHLYSPVTAQATSGTTFFRLVEALHPTPAVGGSPRGAALDWLATHEGLERGWYGGLVGWAKASGEGEAAVAIRSALVAGRTATLFAGCGIVQDSDPEAEYLESELKLRPMLSALGCRGGDGVDAR